MFGQSTKYSTQACMHDHLISDIRSHQHPIASIRLKAAEKDEIKNTPNIDNIQTIYLRTKIYKN